MIAFIVQLIVLILVIGFAYWVYTVLAPLVPLPGPARQLLDAVVLIIVVAAVIFYAVIPLIQSIGHVARI